LEQRRTSPGSRDALVVLDRREQPRHRARTRLREQRRMGQVIVRQLNSSVIETHRRRAKARGVSLEQELRDVITRAATADREGLIRRVDDIRAMTPPPPLGVAMRSAEELIRENRDSR
jgi:antitoxin FitA